MKRAALILLAGLPCLSPIRVFGAVTNSLVIYDVDNVAQTNRPTTFGRVFVCGEIANFPQPLAGGTLLTGSNWQADVKNRCDDGSVRFAIISLIATVPQASSVTITFQNNASTGNNTGYLTQSQMANFNGGSWGAAITATANSASVTVNAATMLAQADPGSSADTRSNFYWLQGPVVTGVVVHDATSASQNDFGWHWDGSTMQTNSGAAYTANSQFASIHPMFTLLFYPSINAVEVGYGLENDWSMRTQDQLYDYVLKAGSALTTVLSRTGSRKLTDVTVTNGSSTISSASANFTGSDVGMPVTLGNYWPSTICSIISSTQARMCTKETAFVTGTNQTVYIGLHSSFTRRYKTFWSGTAPGTVRFDHNFQYLIATRAIPNFDLSVTVSAGQSPGYGTWVTSDFGETGGQGMNYEWGPGWGNNHEGSPLQREDLQYLFNMNAATSSDAKHCGQANSHCAMAWQVVSGQMGAIDTSLANGPQQPTTLGSPQSGNGYQLSGGGGMWSNTGNMPYHARESRTAASGAQSSATNFLFCPNYTGRDALNNTTSCGTGVGNATGMPISRHAHSTGAFLSFGLVSPGVGSLVNPPQGINLDTGHWIDYSYVGYLLTGKYYLLEEEQMAASWLVFATNANGGVFGLVDVNPGGPRYWAWPMQTVAHAAYLSPDGTPLRSYYTGVLNNNMQMEEGILNTTGTALTPSTANTTCTSFSSAAANAWDFGHCGVYSRCGSGVCTPIANTLHNLVPGACRVGGNFGTITGVTAGNPTVFTVSPDVSSQGMATGEPISIWGATGQWATGTTSGQVLGTCSSGVNCVWWATVTGTNQFSIPFNSTGLGSLAGTILYVGSGGQLYPPAATDLLEDWQHWQTGVATGHIQEMGIAASNGTAIQTGMRAVEEMLDTGFNPYAAELYVTGAKNGVGACTSGTDKNAAFTTWSQVLGAFTVPLQGVNNFKTQGSGLTGNFPCSDHGYSLMLRAALAYAEQNGVNSSESNCPSGVCSHSAAWSFAAVNGYTGGHGGAIPYFNNQAYQDDASCTTGTLGQQIKFAIIPRITSLTVSTGSLLDGTTGSAYSRALANIGGTAPFTWSITSGSLPTGLSLATDGTISGTPHTAGSSSFTVQVADASSATDSRALTLTVDSNLVVTTVSLPDGTQSSAYSQSLAASGGFGSYSWSVITGSLPAGLTLAGGTISGTPTTPGTSSFTVQATDGGGNTAAQALSITIAAVSPGGTAGTVVTGPTVCNGCTFRFR